MGIIFNFKKTVKEICWKFVRICCGIGYKNFGAHSLIRKPDRILGKKHIFVGGGVFVSYHARIEAIERYGNDTFTPELIFQDHVSIEQNAHIIATGRLVIGKNTTISANVYIADCAHQYTKIGVDVLEQPLERKDTRIGENSFIGYGAAILPGAVLGKQCIVGANAVVLAGNYPDYSVLAGVPARVVRQYKTESNKWELTKKRR